MAIFWREPPNGVVECRWGRQKSRFWAYIWLHFMLSMLLLARCYEHGAAGSWSRKLWHLSLVVSGWSRRRRRNVYDKKPQRYAKDNRTAHLTAGSDKPVAYVTNNKRLYSTFCTVEANYWQTRSIAWPLCNSRATCYRLNPDMSVFVSRTAGVRSSLRRISGSSESLEFCSTATVQ